MGRYKDGEFMMEFDGEVTFMGHIHRLPAWQLLEYECGNPDQRGYWGTGEPLHEKFDEPDNIYGRWAVASGDAGCSSEGGLMYLWTYDEPGRGRFPITVFGNRNYRLKLEDFQRSIAPTGAGESP